jgi:hypothetical protein
MADPISFRARMLSPTVASALAWHGRGSGSGCAAPEKRLIGGKCGNLGFVVQLWSRCSNRDLTMYRMFLLLSIIALGALCILPDRASAGRLKQLESSVTEFSSRQRCICNTTWHRSTRVIRFSHYRATHHRIRTAYLVGYDPLPYRFGSTFVRERPYRYYWR